MQAFGDCCLQGHQGPVNSLAASLFSDGSIVLASTAADENVRIWECSAGNTPTAHQPRTDGSAPGNVPDSHDVALTGRWETWNAAQTIPWGVQLQHCAALTQLPGKPNWCVEGFTCLAYPNTSNTASWPDLLPQTIHMGSVLYWLVSSQLWSLQPSFTRPVTLLQCRLLLALGNVDNSILLLLRDPAGSFNRVCRLRGHADWIRSLAFKHTAGALRIPLRSHCRMCVQTQGSVARAPCRPLSSALSPATQALQHPGSGRATARRLVMNTFIQS